jgi:ABC-type nitrate/sulfonate/bicarbonate transport system ATPase subunit
MKTLQNDQNFFSCSGITKIYDTVPTIKDISIDIKQGEFVSLLGPSGAGKTTLFNILAGIDTPNSGSVFLSGKNITGQKGAVGYMPQDDLLFEHRTVIDNVILPLLIKGESKKNAIEKVIDFFPKFGLCGYEKKYPHELSGGMRHRAALLRTCQMGTSIILLDEPFSALDAITRAQIQDWYSEISSALNLSTFFITHDIEEALLLSDKIYVLKEKPGIITDIIQVKPLRPRNRNFTVSSEFILQKNEVLQAIRNKCNKT